MSRRISDSSELPRPLVWGSRVMSGGERYVAAGATISKCGRFRYRLWREWRLHPAPSQWDMWTDDDGSPVVDGAGLQLGEPKTCVFVMLNPSTADGEQDDPTIRKCIGFAKSWGYDRLEVINLFAYRATDPRALLALKHDDDPVGWENQRHVQGALRDYPLGKLICAWGAHGGHLGQNETMLGWLAGEPCHALGLTAEGHPRHPLYLPYTAQPVPFGERLRPAA